MKIEKYYLYPSNLFVSTEPHVITTVLGSCIAVCLFDTEKMIGGMNHFMLPLWNGDGLASAKYGNVAMDKLITELERLGARRKNMQAKIFGGANLVNFTMNVGARNTEIAKEILEKEGIRLVAQSTGGVKGRKIFYDTNTGVVQMKYIEKTQTLRHKI